jgi:hypothetical protein
LIKDVGPLATALFYPLFLAMVALIALLAIPRELRKEYFIYGLLVGGLGDVVAVAVFQNVLHVMWFKNLGVLGVHGQMALSPPCWLFTVMLFLYFLPVRSPFRYTYIATWALASVCYGYLVHNAGLFDFRPWFYPIPSYFIFLGWWSFAAWFFRATSPIAAKPDPRSRAR